MSSSQLLMDFDHAKTPSYMEPLDASFSYMDSGLDYLQYPPQSPSFGVSIGRGYFFYFIAKLFSWLF